MTLLAVEDLSLEFETRDGRVRALDRVWLALGPGEILALAGESGAGKSALARAVMGLLPETARVTGGRVLLGGREVRGTAPAEAAMIFQSPRAALNPIRSIGDQLADVLARRHAEPPARIRARAIAALADLGIAGAETRLAALPSELSGGLCQRVGIALALAKAPRLLVADEPTTGVDVTTQAAVMALLHARVKDEGMALLLITHDLALAAAWADRIAILHAGQLAEVAPAAAFFAGPRHPYAAELLAAVPALAQSLADLSPMSGSPPDLTRPDLPPCRFAPRCPRRTAGCDAGPPPRHAAGPGHDVFCRNPL